MCVIKRPGIPGGDTLVPIGLDIQRKSGFCSLGALPCGMNGLSPKRGVGLCS